MVTTMEYHHERIDILLEQENSRSYQVNDYFGSWAAQAVEAAATTSRRRPRQSSTRDVGPGIQSYQDESSRQRFDVEAAIGHGFPSPNSRTRLGEWIYQVTDHFGYSRNAGALAMRYLDMFLARRGMPPPNEEFRLLCVACLFIALKIDPQSPRNDTCSARMLSKLSAPVRPDGSRAREPRFSWREIVAAEQVILEMLDWHMHPPLPSTFFPPLVALFLGIEAYHNLYNDGGGWVCDSSDRPGASAGYGSATKEPNTTTLQEQDGNSSSCWSLQLSPREMHELMFNAGYMMELSAVEYYFLEQEFPPSYIALAALSNALMLSQQAGNHLTAATYTTAAAGDNTNDNIQEGSPTLLASQDPFHALSARLQILDAERYEACRLHLWNIAKAGIFGEGYDEDLYAEGHDDEGDVEGSSRVNSPTSIVVVAETPTKASPKKRTRTEE